MYRLPLLLLAFLVGCTTTREMTISTRPPDAEIAIDGVPRGRAPVTEKLTFRGPDDRRTIIASRPGYEDRIVQVGRDHPGDELLLEMQYLSRRVTFTVSPAAAIISVNDKPITDQPVREASANMQFTIDQHGNWTEYVVTAERHGFEPARKIVTWTDDVTEYVLELQPMRKDVRITTEPPGATIAIAGREVGRTPLRVERWPFRYDPAVEQWVPQRVQAAKPGYPPVETTINWDDGRQEYHIELVPVSKTIRIETSPPRPDVGFKDAGDVEIAYDERQAAVFELPFPPVDDEGTLRTYTAIVSKETADSQWYPQELVIGWDEGRTDYRLTLEEILTREVPLVRMEPRRMDDGWRLVPRQIMTIGLKDVTEGPARESPVHLTPHLPRGTIIDSFTVSPDGQQVLYTVLIGDEIESLRSQMRLIRTDGTGGEGHLTDGRTLDLMPAYTPDGEQIVFTSNRGGRRHSIWSISARGLPGITTLTVGDTLDLNPSVDADPSPRLFYEAYVDTRPDPRLYMTQLGSTRRTDLTHMGGTQPRVSPRADGVLFTVPHPQTGKRDVWRMSDRGGAPINITNSPESDDFDPAWSPDGNRIAFASDRGADEDHPGLYDIWMLDLAREARPVQITSNGSWDDSPAWDPTGDAIYYRSNRGGQWGIWRIPVR